MKVLDKEFIQSSSGFIIELLPNGSRRLNLKEIEDEHIPEGVMVNKRAFNRAYAQELFTLKMIHERTKQIELAKKKEEEIISPQIDSIPPAQ